MGCGAEAAEPSATTTMNFIRTSTEASLSTRPFTGKDPGQPEGARGTEPVAFRSEGGVKGGTVSPFHALHGSGVSTVQCATHSSMRCKIH